MTVMTRREAIFGSGLALAMPFADLTFARPAAAQNASTPPLPAFSKHLADYVQGNFAKTAGILHSDASQQPDLNFLSEHLGMLARHYESTGLDEAAKVMAAAVLTTEHPQTIDATSLPWIDDAVKLIQQHAPSFTREQFVSHNAQMLHIDVESSMKQVLQGGLSGAFHSASDIFRKLGRDSIPSAPSTVAYHNVPAHHPSAKYNQVASQGSSTSSHLGDGVYHLNQHPHLLETAYCPKPWYCSDLATWAALGASAAAALLAAICFPPVLAALLSNPATAGPAGGACSVYLLFPVQAASIISGIVTTIIAYLQARYCS